MRGILESDVCTRSTSQIRDRKNTLKVPLLEKILPCSYQYYSNLNIQRQVFSRILLNVPRISRNEKRFFGRAEREKIC